MTVNRCGNGVTDTLHLKSFSHRNIDHCFSSQKNFIGIQNVTHTHCCVSMKDRAVKTTVPGCTLITSDTKTVKKLLLTDPHILKFKDPVLPSPMSHRVCYINQNKLHSREMILPSATGMRKKLHISYKSSNSGTG